MKYITTQYTAVFTEV